MCSAGSRAYLSTSLGGHVPMSTSFHNASNRTKDHTWFLSGKYLNWAISLSPLFSNSFRIIMMRPRFSIGQDKNSEKKNSYNKNFNSSFNQLAGIATHTRKARREVFFVFFSTNLCVESSLCVCVVLQIH